MTIGQEIGDRLRKWAEENYDTLADFARALEIKPQSLTDYFNGSVTPGNRMKAKLENLGVDTVWLLTGMEPKIVNGKKMYATKNIGLAVNVYGESEINNAVERLKTESHSIFGSIQNIPLIGKIVASPDGKEYFEDFPEGITIPYRKGNYFSMLIENDSLINAPDGEHSFELYPNDVCIFETQVQPKNGDIVAVQLKQSDKRLVKILKHKSKDEIELHSANKFRNYPSVLIRKDEVATFGILVGKQKLTKSEMRKLGIQ